MFPPLDVSASTVVVAGIVAGGIVGAVVIAGIVASGIVGAVVIAGIVAGGIVGAVVIAGIVAGGIVGAVVIAGIVAGGIVGAIVIAGIVFHLYGTRLVVINGTVTATLQAVCAGIIEPAVAPAKLGDDVIGAKGYKFDTVVGEQRSMENLIIRRAGYLGCCPQPRDYNRESRNHSDGEAPKAEGCSSL